MESGEEALHSKRKAMTWVTRAPVAWNGDEIPIVDAATVPGGLDRDQVGGAVSIAFKVDEKAGTVVPIGTKIKDCLKAVFCRCCAKKNIDTAVNDESAAQNNAGESFKEHHSISNQNELIPLNQAQLSARDKPEGNLEMIPI